MRRAVSITTVVCLASLTLLSTGCVQQDRYDQLLTTNKTLIQQLENVKGDRNMANANVATLRGQLTKTKSDNDTLRMRINAMDNELGNQESEYVRLLDRVSKMPARPLPYEVERALEELATAYPELLSFNAEAGMIRFASDLTFDLGSIEIKAAAAATITTLADILNAAEATGLEVQVVGHTDNVPIGKPATRQKHPTNVHLSVHRAISVRSALTAAGIDATRIQVAGYGEFRPITTNGPKGAAENRRVELFLFPMTEPGAWSQRPLATPEQPGEVQTAPEIEPDK